LPEVGIERRLHTVVIGRYRKPSKAQQLNRALEYCTGDIVTVIDAEDDVAEDLLVHVLEYFFWFTSRMAFHAEQGFVPLGGNTVFIRRDLLDRAGGWPQTLTEDCSLGVRLSVEHGATVATAYSAGLTTREEAPPSISIVVGLTVKTPIAIAVLMYLPMLPIAVTVISQLFGLHEFCRAHRQRASAWHYLSVLFLSPLYQIVLAGAAAVAVYKYTVGDDTWYKTGRLSEHRGPIAAGIVAAGDVASEGVAA
jgi:cellulose synthase/poly-beta-1,6-N-acetylglucosamine synthase-like glycosyltransferase